MGDIIEVSRNDGGVSFKARVRRKGEPLRTKTFKRKTDATKWITTMESELLKGRGLPKIHRHTVAEAIDRYIEEVLSNKKATTQSVQKQKLEYWKSRLGPYRLAEIESDILVKERRYILDTKIQLKGHKEPTARGNATANRYIAILRHLFNVCMKKWSWCESNPVTRLRDLRESDGRQCILSDESMKKILEGLEKHPRDDFRLIVKIALTTGCRRGNAQAVKWNDIDFDRGTINFPDTKNNEPLMVPITTELSESLKERKETQSASTPYAFPSAPASRIPYVDVKQLWRTFSIDLGFTDLHFHDLRHAVASFLAKNSVPLFTIGRMLGHKSLESTKRYAHIAVNDMVAHTEILGARLRRVK